MNNNNSVYVIHTKCARNQKEYCIKSKWNSLSFDLTILENAEAFQSHILFEHLKQLATKYEFTVDEYRTEIQSSLSQENENFFLYERKDLEFFISRRENGFIREVICIQLKKVDFQMSAFCFIDEMNAMIASTQKELQSCKCELEQIMKEKNNCQSILENFVHDKNEMEQNLFSQFLLILNEKKSRIQHLEETLQCSQTSKRRAKETISDSETENSEPDDGPSTSFAKKPKKTHELFHDDSDENVMDVLPARGTLLPTKSIPELSENEEKVNTQQKSIPEITKTDKNSQEFFEFTTQDLLNRL